MREFYVYIVASKSRRMYIGVTNDIARRIDQHRRGETEFTARYRMNRLVYVEIYTTALEAIEGEKWMKKRPRREKIAMVETDNPEWRDLAAGWFEVSAGLEELPTADPRPLRAEDDGWRKAAPRPRMTSGVSAASRPRMTESE